GQMLIVPTPANVPALPPATVAVASSPSPKPAAAAPPPGQASAAAAAPAQPNGQAPKKPVAPVAVVTPPRGTPTDGLVGTGLKLLGAPYVWGGSNPSGFDCSGYIWYVAKQAGKSISRGMLGE